MADLVTHLCTALLPGAFLRGRLVPLVACGTVLPDALGRAIPLGLERLCAAGVPIPGSLLWPWSALHEPFGCAMASIAVGTAFVSRDRAAATGALWLGCVLHTALDVLQDHHGEGYLLLAPFSAARFELGWIGSEATVPIAWPLAAVTAAAWLPAGVEALVGRPRIGPGALLLLAVPVGAAIGAGGPEAGVWAAAAALTAAAACGRWWEDRPLAYLAAGLGLAVALAVALALG